MCNTSNLNLKLDKPFILFILSTALEKELDYALRHKIPVFMVVAVIGSTEESAVDDISKILELKPIYEAKVRFQRYFELNEYSTRTFNFRSFLREKKTTYRVGRFEELILRDFLKDFVQPFY